MKTSIISEIVNLLINTELEQFKKNYVITPIPKSQDISSLSIAWLCYYCKENISVTNRNEIISYVDNVMQSDNYDTVGWSRIAALQAAAYALTKNEIYLNPLLQNISCHQAINRVFILESVSIICPIIPIENGYFKHSIEYNLKTHQGLADIGVLLFLNSMGDDEVKGKWLKEASTWVSLQSIDLFDNLISGNIILEDFFSNILNEIKTHILFSILKHSYSYNNQLNLFDKRDVLPKTLNLFQDNHPLEKKSFQLNFMK